MCGDSGDQAAACCEAALNIGGCPNEDGGPLPLVVAAVVLPLPPLLPPPSMIWRSWRTSESADPGVGATPVVLSAPLYACRG